MLAALLALACVGRRNEEPTQVTSRPQEESAIPNEEAPEIAIDTDNDGDFDNSNQYDGGEWSTFTYCSNPQLSLLIRGRDGDQENGAPSPEIRVAIYAPYVPEYLYANFDIIDEVGDYLYLNPATYLTEISPGIYQLDINEWSELDPFCDMNTQSLYLRLDAFDGVHKSEPIDVRLDFEGQAREE